jgi:hypothetical protein
MALLLQNPEGGPNRRVAGRIRNVLEDLRYGGTPPAVEDVHDLALPPAEGLVGAAHNAELVAFHASAVNE